MLSCARGAFVQAKLQGYKSEVMFNNLFISWGASKLGASLSNATASADQLYVCRQTVASRPI
jgi:hypothetical protein